MFRATILFLLSVLPFAAAGARTNAFPKLVVHLLPAGGAGCTKPGRAPACAGIVTNGTLDTWYAYVLVQQADAAAGVFAAAFAIDYEGTETSGVDIFSWSRCAVQEFHEPNWPMAGTGNVVFWDTSQNCQRTEPGGPGTGVAAVVGYFYLAAYTPDDLSIIPRSGDGRATVTDCASHETTLASTDLGSARFSASGGEAGYNPCIEIPPGGFSCGITGPSPVPVATTVVYAVQTSNPASSYDWTVTGNGTIVGSATGSSVSVMSGSQGSFGLSLHFNVIGGGAGDCQKTVTVVPPFSPGCSINGPSTVMAGTTGYVYSISTNTPATSYEWTVSGGSIVGSSTGPSIVYTAGLFNPLSSVQVTFQALFGGSGSCGKSIDVNIPPACPNPCGPDEVLEGSLTTYTSANSAAIPQYDWSVIGNGTVEGSTNQQSARIRAGSASGGSMTVKVYNDGQLPIAPSSPVSTHTRIVTILPTPPAPPGANDEAAILLHLRPPIMSGPCGFDNLPACLSVNTSGVLNPSHYFAYVVAAGAYTNGAPRSGIGGLQFGIQYDGAPHSGVDILSWTACGATETPSVGWPGSGTGNRLTWDPSTQCQIQHPEASAPTVSALAGYFYLTAYSPDRLHITSRPEDGIASIKDCLGVDTIIEDAAHPNPQSHLGFASFSLNGDVPGYNPCSTSIPVVIKTWSGIKALFR